MWFPVERFGAITELRTSTHWSAATLAKAVRTRASALRALGVNRGDRVLIAQGSSASFFADLFATWHVGACAICVSPAVTAPEIENLVGFFEPVVLLVGAGAGIASEAPIRSVHLADEPPTRDDHHDQCRAALDDDALILLTSGTTGRPKGVVHSFRSLLARLALNRAIIGDDALQRTLCLLPAHFGHGLIGNSLTPLVGGHHLFVGSDGGLPLLSNLDRVIDDHRITFMSSVPTTWRLTLQLCGGTPKLPLARVHVGSAFLPEGLWRSIVDWSGTREVVNAYGLTETANWVGGASAAVHEPRDGLVGRVWGGAAAVIADDGRLMDGGEGEIVLQTPSLMRGYYQRQDLDAETWRDGWFRTRDRGYLDGDGTIRLLGRLGQEINRGGTKIHPEDLEQLLERHEDVAETCAFGFEDEILGQGVGVAVVLTTESHAELGTIKQWTAARLSPEKLPDAWYVIDRIPTTDRGKIDRRAVASYCLGLPVQTAAAPSTRNS